MYSRSLINTLWPKGILLLLLLAHASHSLVQLSDLDNIVINSWLGISGDLNGYDQLCVISCDASNGLCTDTSERRDYKITASTSGITDSAGNFYISNGSDNLKVDVIWQHATLGNFVLTNHDVTFSSTPHLTGAINCADPNATATITMIIPAAELAAASAGTYSETFQIDLCRYQSNDPSDEHYNTLSECLWSVNLAVTIPELVQISGLETIDFATYVGESLLTSHDFCVFRNGAGGFALTLAGNNDHSSVFHLNGSELLPYTIEFSQGAGYFNATPSLPLTNSTTGFTASAIRDCNGGTNMTLRLRINASDIESRVAGVYSDTIVITVAPD